MRGKILNSVSEFIFQAVVMVLESKGDTATSMMMKLLQSFWKTGLITVDQMNRVSLLLFSTILCTVSLSYHYLYIFFSPAGFPARLWWAAWNQPRCATCPLYHGDFCGPVLSGVCHHQTAEGCLSLQVNRGLLSNDFRSVPLRVPERIRKIIHLVPVDNKGVKWRCNSTFIHAKTIKHKSL